MFRPFLNLTRIISGTKLVLYPFPSSPHRSTLNKIVEKAELITHLSRSARSSGTHSRRISAAGFLSTTSSNNNGSPRKATSTSNLLAAAAGSPSTPLLVSSQSLRTPNHDPSNTTASTARSGHRFRTGGIVVTAAQPLPKQRRAHLRSGLTGARTSNNSPTKLPTPTTTTIDIQLTTLCSETESEKNLKIISTSSKKHKKKRTAGGTGTGGTGSRDKSAIKILT